MVKLTKNSYDGWIAILGFIVAILFVGIFVGVFFQIWFMIMYGTVAVTLLSIIGLNLVRIRRKQFEK